LCGLPTYLRRVQGKEAEDLKAKCPMDVFDIEDLGGSLRATAARPRDCTLCRECVREGRWPNKVTSA
jgi:DNA-directed RNA polymerase I and III subunit RPAC1